MFPDIRNKPNERNVDVSRNFGYINEAHKVEPATIGFVSNVHMENNVLLDSTSPTHDTSPHDTPTHENTDHGSSAEHESSSGHGTTSLFGSISHIGTEIGTISIILIVAGVLFLETIFESLHVFTHETSFTHMVLRIENELMIVGCSAFIFKILLNTTTFLDSKWSHALEYAGQSLFISFSLCLCLASELLIPIVSFCYCICGFLLIMMALKQCDLWSKAYHLKLIELIDEYLSKTKSIFFRFVPYFF